MTQSTVFNINLSKTEKCRYIYLAIAASNPCIINDSNYTTDFSFDTGAGNNYPLAVQMLSFASLMKSCVLMSFNFGGHSFTINQQQVQSLFEANLEDYLYHLDHPNMSIINAPFRFDISRFGLDKYFGDDFGSSSGNQMVCQLTMNFNVGSRIALDQVTTAGTFDGKFTVRAYVETQSEAACENGIYKNVA